ncbi:2'-5' RNA ligase family protein [Streptomyces shaanxiensis]
MRLFAAVLPPQDVAEELAARGRRVEEAARARTGCAGPAVPGWHFTLAFYGEVDDDVVPELSARLERAGPANARLPAGRARGWAVRARAGAVGRGLRRAARCCGCSPIGRRRRGGRPGWRWGSTGATRRT